ncbi:MAG: preprotein translocase subunit SecA [Alphaproteobacteria bacterium]
MFKAIGKRLFGSANDRYVKTLGPIVEKINGLEAETKTLSDEQLLGKTEEFRGRIEKGESLDALLPEAFAVVREAAVRVYGMRHFDVQLMGGIVLHRGEIAEMRTGEGKTLTGTLPIYLNALSGKGVHVVTVNDYLATRDSAEMGQIFAFLGMSTGCVVPDVEGEERMRAYACDVTYATNNEIGFDYLRDNMKFRLDEMVQRDFNFAIVDEVDSILIDEARTPLIISGPAEDSSELYNKVDTIIPSLNAEDYEIDEKAKSAIYTEDGVIHMEELMAAAELIEEGSSLYDSLNVGMLHHANAALRAHMLFTRDKDYMVRGGNIVIIDEFTGRALDGRRFGDGLHQALEAKEKVQVNPENTTYASITFQNLFRMYDKLSGMTGTAMTEAEEFSDIYNLTAVELPTNEPMIRDDQDDEVYRTEVEKNKAVVRLIKECQARKQPVLVGTVSIEKSESLSAELKKQGVKHQVLNARYHEQEAQIIAQAGQPEAVTIATNMAGRGTDIQLGGNLDMRVEVDLADVPEGPKRDEKIAAIKAELEENKRVVKEAGGLFVLGTERHESRRIDNQLRGRSGRQGDPGASRFFLSLQDDLMRIFGSDRMDSMLRRIGLKDDEAIIHPWINKAVEKSQVRVEARNYDIRKNLLKFDNVMNDQRKVVYEKRRHFMKTDDVSEEIIDMREEVVEDLVVEHIPAGSYTDQWDVNGLHQAIMDTLKLDLPIADWTKEEGIGEEELEERINQAINTHMAKMEVDITAENMRLAEKSVALQLLDQQWKQHLLLLIQLRDGIGLRSFGQRDPLNEYKREAFELFEDMLGKFRTSTTSFMSSLQLNVQPAERPAPVEGDMNDIRNLPAWPEEVDPNTISRNAPCPCGSGEKFKHCHGRFV